MIGRASHRIIVANWFAKDIVEDEMDVDLTKEQYQELVEQYNDSGMPDEVSGIFWPWCSDAMDELGIKSEEDEDEEEYDAPKDKFFIGPILAVGVVIAIPLIMEKILKK